MAEPRDAPTSAQYAVDLAGLALRFTAETSWPAFIAWVDQKAAQTGCHEAAQRIGSMSAGVGQGFASIIQQARASGEL